MDKKETKKVETAEVVETKKVETAEEKQAREAREARWETFLAKFKKDNPAKYQKRKEAGEIDSIPNVFE